MAEKITDVIQWVRHDRVRLARYKIWYALCRI